MLFNCLMFVEPSSCLCGSIALVMLCFLYPSKKKKNTNKIVSLHIH